MPPRATSDCGGGLIIVAVWALFFLGLLAVAVAAHVSTNMEVAGRVKRRSLAGNMAKAAMAHASLVLTSNTNEWDALDENWSHGDKDFRSLPFEGGFGRVWHTNIEENISITTNYGLIDEERKINISLPFNNGPILKSLMVIVGGLDGATATEISNAIMDWKDADDDERDGGAENPYYQGKDPSYPCHNYIFDSLEELTLVKGVDESLFSRLKDSITIFGNGSVNLNTARRESLVVLAHSWGATTHVSRSLADKILDYREQGLTFSAGGSIDEMRAEILDSLHKMVGLTIEEQEVLQKMINAGQLGIRSSEFRGWASGHINGRPVDDRTVEFVMHGQDGRILYWRGD
ncbi:MAG: type II secretion system protein GspK [Verrucomicrobia bacterium]|nr:type II secretion system protein GspK [Verrucomicrobiota bacterium]